MVLLYVARFARQQTITRKLSGKTPGGGMGEPGFPRKVEFLFIYFSLSHLHNKTRIKITL